MDVPGEFYAKKHPGGPKIQPSTTLGVRWRLKIRFFDEKISVFRPRIIVSTSYNGVDIDIPTYKLIYSFGQTPLVIYPTTPNAGNVGFVGVGGSSVSSSFSPP